MGQQESRVSGILVIGKMVSLCIQSGLKTTENLGYKTQPLNVKLYLSRCQPKGDGGYISEYIREYINTGGGKLTLVV